LLTYPEANLTYYL